MARVNALTLLLFLALSACGGKSGPAAVNSSASDGGAGGDSMQKPPQPGGNFLVQFPLNQVMDGGVGKDGIPALTDPPFVDPGSADAAYLQDDDLVLGVALNGEAKAYPHNIGWWNEIINDQIGGRPIIVSLCPLTGTGLVFDGQDSDGSRIRAGVSGLLFNNNLILYDRRDPSPETLYPQMIHTGVTGPRQGSKLPLLPVVETTWRYWKRLYPNTRVVSGNNGVYPLDRYRNYPYGDYRSLNTSPLFPVTPASTSIGGLFAPKQVVLGVRFGELAKAYPFSSMGNTAVLNDTLDEIPILVVWYAREQLAIPYERRVNTTVLTFDMVDSDDPVYPFLLKDRETGATWNLKGEAVAGALKGSRLKQVPAHNAFWFAWAAFWQNTGIYR